MIELSRMRWWHLPEVMRIEESVFPQTAWTEGQFWGELSRVPQARQYTVALGDGSVVGYVGLNVLAPEADIQTIAVASTAQGSGVGTMLLQHALESAVARKCSQMFLEVREDNAPAISMYERFGFQRLQVRRDYYGSGLHGIVMRKSLP